MTKKMLLIFIFLLFVTSMGLVAQDISLLWNTFLGSAGDDKGESIALDSSGNIYVTGWSDATWGSPVNAHSGGNDAYIAAMDSSGNLLWNTFLGSAADDAGYGIAIDSSGNIYVTGESWLTWGSPVNAHSGHYDAFVACMDSSGNLVWNTFLGSAIYDEGKAIALDSSGNIYVTGRSDATWGTPINAHSFGYNNDIFVARLDANGNLLWNTFLGSTDSDISRGLALDSTGNVYISGQSVSSWGSPINSYSGSWDAFVACLNPSGTLLWNTFLGSTTTDYGRGIDLDSSGNVYVTGYSATTWGTPVNPHTGYVDAYVACLNSSGNLIWNTFMGSTSVEVAHGIGLNDSGNIHVVGDSGATWGSPVNAHSGGYDAFVACMDSSGNLLWNTFLGSLNDDNGYDITLDSSNNIYLTGYSDTTWGLPINAHSGGDDAFVARLFTQPLADIIANGSDGPISITESDTLQIRVSLNTFGSTANADFWLAYKTSSGWYHYNKTTKTWEPGLGVTHQGALFDLNNKKVFQSSGLNPGTYRFYFGVDMNMNGTVTKSCLYYDMVKVTVTSD